MPPGSIVVALEALSSMDDVEGLRRLEAELKSVTPSSLSPAEYQAFFALFERFPDHDGHGLFRVMIHLLERSSNYERYLVQSLRRQPCELNTSMVFRIINAGYTRVGGVDARHLLAVAAANVNTPASVRASILEFIGGQQTQRAGA